MLRAKQSLFEERKWILLTYYPQLAVADPLKKEESIGGQGYLRRRRDHCVTLSGRKDLCCKLLIDSMTTLLLTAPGLFMRCRGPIEDALRSSLLQGMLFSSGL